MKIIQTILLFFALSASVCAATVKIANVRVKLTTGVYINSTTNLPSKVIVRYGMSPSALTSSVADNVFRTSHRVTVDCLNFGTKYFYKIIVTGKNGAKAKSPVSFFITEQFR